jgi:hypothetical protein
VAEILPHNARMIALAKRGGGDIHVERVDETVVGTLRL